MLRWVGLGVAIAAIAASATPARSETLSVTARLGGASWEEVNTAVGPVQLHIRCPEVRVGLDPMESWRTYDKRTVTITLGQAGTAYRDLSILRGLLTRAREEALTECRIEEQGFRGISDRGDIGPTEILGSPYDRAPVEVLAHTDGYSTFAGHWDKVVDQWADKEAHLQKEAEEAAIAQERAEREQAQAQARVVAAAERAIRAAQEAEAQRRFTASFWGWVRLIGAGLALFWLWSQREPLARWYYRTFSPHPAELLVRDAIASQGALSGDRLVQALATTDSGGPVLQGVRREQAELLFRDLQRENARRADEMARRARADALAGYEQAADEGLKEAIALAAVALERVKAAEREAKSLRSGTSQ